MRRLARDQTQIYQHQQPNTTQVTKAPADARDPPHVPLAGDVDDHGVVVQVGEFVEKRQRRQQAHPEQQKSGFRADEKARRHQPDHQQGVHDQPQLAPAGFIRALPNHRGGHRNNDAGDGVGAGQPLGSAFVGAEDV